MSQNLKEITQFELRNRGLTPQKHLGQNFLINPHVLDKIILAADLKDDDSVLEIGAGLGILTQALAEKSRKVRAIEKDPHLVKILKEKFANCPKIEILEEDARLFLKEDPDLSSYKVVANLPFYLTSPLIFGLMGLTRPPSVIVIMIQKEVAERICAQPPKANRLAVICQFRGSCQIICQVPPIDFWPVPEVSAIVLKISEIKNYSFDPQLLRLINTGFAAPRKTLANNLLSLRIDKEFLTQCGFPEKIRAGALKKEDWIHLRNCFLEKKNAIIETI